MSPVEIEVALHYRYSPEQFPRPWSAFVSQTHHWFESAGLLERSGGTSIEPEWKSTEKLDVFVRALCAVQLPVLEKRWVIPENPATVDASGATT